MLFEGEPNALVNPFLMGNDTVNPLLEDIQDC